ncbi:MAG: tellurite resistance/C4-dicarboxylate transporter family protein [Deltaproteobacteria bacterium]|nr:tellurite resistance/C4-dicarboxylate transporter family protein [Deltaproteobacteria bacterium]
MTMEPTAASAPPSPASDLETMSPAYFALVMATGFVSVAALLAGMRWIALALLAVNAVAYPVLWLLTVMRALRYGDRVVADLTDHQRGPGFFTAVASTCVLGAQTLLIMETWRIALAFWILGIVLWVLLTYGIFTALIVKQQKPSLGEGITGAWLLAVVATQSVAVLGALIAAHIAQPYRLEMNFVALSMWLWGGMLYIWMISLIFYRYTFFSFSPADLAPPYWINMGAMAISTLGGSLLILNSADAPFLLSLLPFIKGFTVFYWATGTWWIPMLIVLATWRYAYRRFPLSYDPLYWGAVFPLAVYTVATFRMAEALQLEFLYPIPRVFVFIALSAWLLTFTALLRQLIARARSLAARGFS